MYSYIHNKIWAQRGENSPVSNSIYNFKVIISKVYIKRSVLNISWNGPINTVGKISCPYVITLTSIIIINRGS